MHRIMVRVYEPYRLCYELRESHLPQGGKEVGDGKARGIMGPGPRALPKQPCYEHLEPRQYLGPGIAPFPRLALVAKPVAVGPEYLDRHPMFQSHPS